MDSYKRGTALRGAKPKIKAIQGLRALSVLAVICFDAGFTWVPGGFIGIDIFFVLSGFLLTQMIVGEIGSTGEFGFQAFYTKRIRRLLPASLLVILATISVGRHLLPSERLRGLGWDAITSALYGMNYRAYFSGMDFLNPGFSPSILMHYWTLAVEGQFFLIWPILIWIGYRLLNEAGIVVVTLLAVGGSVAHTHFLAGTNPPLEYFSAASRTWEFAIGGALFLFLSKFNNLPERLDPVFAWGGFALIFYWITFQNIDQHTVRLVPLSELVAVIGTLLILIGSYNGKFSFSFLISNPLLYGIGEISYCLYLWHWPIYFLMQHVLGKPPSGLALFLYFFLTFSFSIATYMTVERPIRNYRRLALRSGYSFVWGGAVTAIVIGAAIGLLGWDIHQIHFGNHPVSRLTSHS